MFLYDSIRRNKYGDIPKCPINKSEYRTFTSRDEADNWGNSIYSAWAKKYVRTMNLTHSISPRNISIQTSALECYCGYCYRQINSYMRGNDSVENIFIEAAHILSLIIASAPPIPEKIVVYRLVCDKFVDDMLENNRHNRPIIESAFLSTSLLIDVSYQEEWYSANKNMLKIYVPQNILGVYVNPITNRGECEMLISPNNALRLIEYPYRDNTINKDIYECELFSFNCYT